MHLYALEMHANARQPAPVQKLCIKGQVKNLPDAGAGSSAVRHLAGSGRAVIGASSQNGRGNRAAPSEAGHDRGRRRVTGSKKLGVERVGGLGGELREERVEHVAGCGSDSGIDVGSRDVGRRIDHEGSELACDAVDRVKYGCMQHGLGARGLWRRDAGTANISQTKSVPVRNNRGLGRCRRSEQHCEDQSQCRDKRLPGGGHGCWRRRPWWVWVVGLGTKGGHLKRSCCLELTWSLRLAGDAGRLFVLSVSFSAKSDPN